MAKYYYRRYADKLQYSRANEQVSHLDKYAQLPYGQVYECQIDNPSQADQMIASSLGCNVDTGYYAYNYRQNVNQVSYIYSDTLYLLICSATEAWSVEGNGYSPASAWSRNDGARLIAQYTITPTHVPGDYIGEVIAEDGAYPDDGYNADDGYYYVKDRLAVQLFARVNGAWVETQTRARVGGVWVDSNVSARVNGAWLG